MNAKAAVALLVLTLASCSAAGVPAASDPAIELGSPTFTGKGCAEPGAVAVELSADGAKLQVAFPDSFAARAGASGGAKHVRVACNGVLPLTVPKGYSVGITREALDGDVSIPQEDSKHEDERSGAYAQASSEVFFAAQRRGPKAKQRFESPGALRFSSTGAGGKDKDGGAATTWSVCGGAATLRVNAAVTAHGDGARIAGRALRFRVTYKPCRAGGEADSDAEDAVATSARVRRGRRHGEA